MSKSAKGLGRPYRAGEWWDHKILPLLAIFYGTAWITHNSIARLWLQIFLLVAAIGAGAAYVSVINDFSDRDDDRAAGKPNRMIGRSKAQSTALVALPLAVG